MARKCEIGADIGNGGLIVYGGGTITIAPIFDKDSWTADYLVVDDAARMDRHEVVATRNALARDSLLVLSTPGKRDGWFFEMCRSDEGAWDYREVPSSECPSISPESLAEAQKAMGRIRYEQEYLCKFVAA